jgi:hypothetical protein
MKGLKAGRNKTSMVFALESYGLIFTFFPISESCS